jgi:hypothetical protein
MRLLLILYGVLLFLLSPFLLLYIIAHLTPIPLLFPISLLCSLIDFLFISRHLLFSYFALFLLQSHFNIYSGN